MTQKIVYKSYLTVLVLKVFFMCLKKKSRVPEINSY